MRWEPMVVGALLLSVACGGGAETPMTDPMLGVEAPSPAVLPPSMQANPGAGGGESQGAPEMNTDTNPDVAGVETDSVVLDDPAAEDAAAEDAAAEDAAAEDAAAEDPAANDPREPDLPMVDTAPALDPSEGADPSQTEPEPDETSEPGGTELEPATEGDVTAPLSFAADIWPLWSMDRDPVFVYRGMGSYTGCADQTAPCHGAANPGAQLSMADAETAYAQMMDTSSMSGICDGTQRVVVGDPEQSCLILFYVGRLGPEDLDWVDEAEIELMREWIRQGALP